MGNRPGLLLSPSSLKRHIQAPTAFQTSLPLSFSLWPTLGSGARVGSFLHWVTGITAESIHPRTGDGDQAPNRLIGLLPKRTLKSFLLQLICKLLPNTTPFVFYEGGETVGEERIPVTTTKEARQCKTGAGRQGHRNKNSGRSLLD